MEHLGSGSGGNSIFQSLSTPGEFVYCKETLEDNTGVCFYWLHLNMHLFLCFIYFLDLFMFFVYMVHEDKNSILDDHVNYVWFVLYLFLLCPPCFCGSHLFHRSQHCPMGIVAINPAKQKYWLWGKCSKPSCQVCLLIRIPRKCPPTQLGRWWGDERVLGI